MKLEICNKRDVACVSGMSTQPSELEMLKNLSLPGVKGGCSRAAGCLLCTRESLEEKGTFVSFSD